MSKRDLLIEIGLEEMPARVISSSIEQFSAKLERWLSEKAVAFGDVKVFSTPRRLAVLVKDVAEAQEDIHEEAKGPARKIAQDESGGWTKAALGFARGQGVSVEDIYFKEINGVEYVHVNKFIEGKPTFDLLPEVKEIIIGLTFPKNMRWGNEDLRYIRPIKWIAALFGTEVIDFRITHVAAGRSTVGHRFLGESVTIDTPEDYEHILKQQFVIADSEERKNMIRSQIANLESGQNWVIPIDEDLLEEVNNLVEYPTVLFGRFEEEFLEVPQEVLITSMKEHQRYFPVKNSQGELLPFFVTVRNGDERNLDIVAKGNEKVLRARLSDAAFFYKEDQKLEIDSALKKLETIVYHEEIGTLAEKTERVHRLTGLLADKLDLNEREKELASRAAQIAKFDLVSHMVYEFPELQGYMGEKYALLKGEPKEVAAAINDHYMPRHADDQAPPSITGAVLSVAEKIDTVASFFAIGIIPTGSQDPYALRRQASGIVQVLLEKEWPISLEDIVSIALDQMSEAGVLKRDRQEVENDLLVFLKARIKHLLNERQVSYDVIDALLDSKIGNVSRLVERAGVLQHAKNRTGFKEEMEALSRVMNIAAKNEGNAVLNSVLFKTEYEANLYNKYKELYEQYVDTESETERFELLVSLKQDIELFFDHTMVMAEDMELRNNRLALMKEISDFISSYAAVNKIIAV
ncbi:glycine--tRNA ligase subunit beta [Peribacillus sp. SCS-155]|uniref:glycine--tRNA ligase subunit beta n=1 Tax=Peribacillus sedimenti TaxID=3115297 RepID=UPI0039063709